MEDDQVIETRAYVSLRMWATAPTLHRNFVLPLTDAAYVAAEGMMCPVCGSRSLEGQDRLEPQAGYAAQTIQCADCGKIYWDQYRLVGYGF